MLIVVYKLVTLELVIVLHCYLFLHHRLCCKRSFRKKMSHYVFQVDLCLEITLWLKWLHEPARLNFKNTLDRRKLD